MKFKIGDKVKLNWDYFHEYDEEFLDLLIEEGRERDDVFEIIDKEYTGNKYLYILDKSPVNISDYYSYELIKFYKVPEQLELFKWNFLKKAIV